ncbi:MAG: hypothetical protein IT436_04090 [Phycisphaerales bacterium]|nr:hypothetical protein [Phycisphaerales bacterium]
MRAMRLTVLMTVACAAGSARAEIVHFVNPAPGQPGHYGWGYELGLDRWLDITRPSTQQASVQSGGAVGQVREDLFTASYVWHWPESGRPRASILQESSAGFGAWPLLHGSPIGPGGIWHDVALFIEVEWFPEYSVNSPFPEGERRYVGVRTDDGRHGWVEVERVGISLRAFSWAYETEPGVPIRAGEVPAPGTRALLALASVFTLRRRRS